VPIFYEEKGISPGEPERPKPTWLTLYGFYLGGALLLSALAMVRFAGEEGLFAGAAMIPTAGFYSFAVYSLLHWQVGWARKFNLSINAAIAILGLVYMTPLGGQLPSIVYVIYSFIVVPVFAAISAESLQTASPVMVSAIGLVFVSIAAYWSVCWWKFAPSAEGSAADLESEELSRDVRSVVRNGIIATFVFGVLALIKALSDGADGNLAWSAAAGLSLFIGLVAMSLTRMFPGEDTLSDEEVEELLEEDVDRGDGTHGSTLYGQTIVPVPAQASDVDPLADNELNADEIRHLEAMRQKAKRQKDNVFNKDVSGLVFVLIGIPAALVIGFVALMVTISEGGGYGTFLGIFMLLGIIGVLKVLKG